MPFEAVESTRGACHRTGSRPGPVHPVPIDRKIVSREYFGHEYCQQRVNRGRGQVVSSGEPDTSAQRSDQIAGKPQRPFSVAISGLSPSLHNTSRVSILACVFHCLPIHYYISYTAHHISNNNIEYLDSRNNAPNNPASWPASRVSSPPRLIVRLPTPWRTLLPHPVIWRVFSWIPEETEDLRRKANPQRAARSRTRELANSKSGERALHEQILQPRRCTLQPRRTGPPYDNTPSSNGAAIQFVTWKLERGIRIISPWLRLRALQILDYLKLMPNETPHECQTPHR